jgi:transcriptional regulator with XRE-family HTH domain
VLEEPPSDYQDFELWCGQWNTAHGEVLRSLPRSRAEEVGLVIPGEHRYDWWLLDEARLMVMPFDGDGALRPPYLVTDRQAVEVTRAEWEVAMASSTVDTYPITEEGARPPACPTSLGGVDNRVPWAWLTADDGLAPRLKAMRVRSGQSGQDLAEAVGWSPSEVSRVENGRTLPTAEDVRAWAQRCGGAEVDQLVDLVTAASTIRLPWKQRLGRGRAGLAEAYNRLFAETTRCVMVEVVVVPGPLQPVDYSLALGHRLWLP